MVPETHRALPFAVALLADPVSAYACVIVALAAFVYAYHTRRFVPAFTGTSAALLAALAFMHEQPSLTGLLVLAFGVALLHAELCFATYGVAALLGLAGCAGGAWLLLAPPTWPRAAAALLGTLLLLAAVLRGMRVRTLPRA